MDAKPTIQKKSAGYRILAVFLFASCCLLAAAADFTVATVPNVRLTDPADHVSNPDGIITAPDVAQINRLLNGLEDSLSIEVAVVALQSIDDEDISNFAADLFKQWGLGKKGEDNGLLVLLVTGQRAVKFETGYGLEGVFPDAISSRIQQRYMIPDFKANNFSAGMLKGVEEITRYFLASDYRKNETVAPSYFSSDDFRGLVKVYLALTLLVTIGFIWRISTVGKRNPGYNPVEILQHSDQTFSQLGCITALLFLPGILLLGIWYFFYRKILERRTHICPNCGRTHFHALSPEEGAPLLDVREQKEQELGSVKHTAYRCDDCHYVYKNAVDSPGSPYSRCPRCGTKALIPTGSRVIQKPTYVSNGLTEETCQCKMCNYTDHHKKITGRLRRGALIGGLGGLGGGLLGGGGSFGGGGLGGGSWGGGASGGGGSIGRF